MSARADRESTGSRRSREDRSAPRLFYIGTGLLLIGIAVAGFWPSYFAPLLRGDQMTMRLPRMIRAPVIHLHAALFIGWLTLLVGQAALVARKDFDLHMKLGKYGLGLGAVVVTVAFLAVVLRTNILLAETELTLSESPVVNLGIILQPIIFSILLGLGFAYRRRPEAHKRYMILASFAIMPAATDRMQYLLGPYSMEIMVFVFVALVFAYDYRTLRRVHMASLLGAGLLLVNAIVFSLPSTAG